MSLGTDGLFAKLITERMAELNLSMAHVAQKLGSTYEHVRKLSKGLAYPSPHMLDHLARILRLDTEELGRTVVADKIRFKFGGMPALLAGKKPDMQPLEETWDSLTQDQKDDLLFLARSMVQRNIAHNKLGTRRYEQYQGKLYRGKSRINKKSS